VAVVYTAVKFLFPYKKWSLLNRRINISFSRRSLLHVVKRVSDRVRSSRLLFTWHVF